MREVRIARLALRLVTANAGDGNGGGGGPWQALLSGQLLLPISLQGVSVWLAPAPPKPRGGGDAATAAAPATGSVTERAAGDSASTSSLGTAGVANSGGVGRKGRSLRGPLAVLAHLPLRVEGLAVFDEVSHLQATLPIEFFLGVGSGPGVCEEGGGCGAEVGRPRLFACM